MYLLTHIASEECLSCQRSQTCSHMELSLASGNYNRTALTLFQVSSLKQKGPEKVFQQGRQKGTNKLIAKADTFQVLPLSLFEDLQLASLVIIAYSQFLCYQCRNSMSTVSKEQQGQQQMEESKEEEEAKLMLIRAEKVIEEEECKTPTGSPNKIPAIQNCPPAPRKKRRHVSPFSSSRMKRSSPTELNFRVVRHQEVESFFHSIFQLTRFNKRCRSI